MKWVDRYINAVGEQLPAKQRADIEKELRSLILDALEGRTGSSAEVTEEDELAVLREFGRPEDVAQRYAPTPRYLIGPRLYPIYRIVLRVLIIVSMVGISLAMFGESIFSNTDGFAVLGNVVERLFDAVISAIGSVTLVFAIIERATPASAWDKMKEKPWDPAQLTAVSSDKRFGMADGVFSVLFTLLGLVAVNLVSYRIWQMPDFSARYPVLDVSVFLRYLPWWNLLLGLTLVHTAVLWIKGRWSVGARIRAIALDLGALALLAFLVSAPLLIPGNFVLCGGPESAEALRQAGEIVPKLLRAVFAASMVFTVWDLATHVVALVKTKLR